MPTQPEERRRLAALMDERRLELGLRWQEVASAGGISLRALNNARTGDREIRPLTRRGIERGLRWAPGSIERILSGGAASAAGGMRRDPGATPEDDALSDIMKDGRLPLEMRQAFAELARRMRAAADDGEGDGAALRPPAPGAPPHDPQAPRRLGPGRPRVPERRRERVAHGGHPRLQLPDPAVGRAVARHDAPHLQQHRARRVGGPDARRQVAAPPRVELAPQQHRRRPPQEEHPPQHAPGNSPHSSPAGPH
jgi:hypothetical protein